MTVINNPTLPVTRASSQKGSRLWQDAEKVRRLLSSTLTSTSACFVCCGLARYHQEERDDCRGLIGPGPVAAAVSG